MAKKSRNLTDAEKKYIIANYKNKTDKQIADELNRTERAIAAFRRRSGIKKTSQDVSNSQEIATETNEILPGTAEFEAKYGDPLEGLTEEQKIDLKKQLFENSDRAKDVKKLLNNDEYNYYVRSWITFVLNEKIMPHEEETLHLALMELIRAKRIQEQEKKAMDSDSMEDKVFYDAEYDRTIKRYKELMHSLNASRLQRTQNNKDAGITFVSVIQKMGNRGQKEKVGKHFAMMQYIKEAWKQKAQEEGHIHGEF